MGHENTECPICEARALAGDDLYDHLLAHGIHELAGWIAENH